MWIIGWLITWMVILDGLIPVWFDYFNENSKISCVRWWLHEWYFSWIYSCVGWLHANDNYISPVWGCIWYGLRNFLLLPCFRPLQYDKLIRKYTYFGVFLAKFWLWYGVLSPCISVYHITQVFPIGDKWCPFRVLLFTLCSGITLSYYPVLQWPQYSIIIKFYCL